MNLGSLSCPWRSSALITVTLSRRLGLALVATRNSFVQHISITVAATDATSTSTRSSRDGEKRGSEFIRWRRATRGGGVEGGPCLHISCRNMTCIEHHIRVEQMLTLVVTIS